LRERRLPTGSGVFRWVGRRRFRPTAEGDADIVLPPRGRAESLAAAGIARRGERPAERSTPPPARAHPRPGPDPPPLVERDSEVASDRTPPRLDSATHVRLGRTNSRDFQANARSPLGSRGISHTWSDIRRTA